MTLWSSQRDNAVHIKSMTLPCEAILDYEINYSYSKTTTGAVTQNIIKTFVAGDRVHLLNVSESCETCRPKGIYGYGCSSATVQEPDKDKRMTQEIQAIDNRVLQ